MILGVAVQLQRGENWSGPGEFEAVFEGQSGPGGEAGHGLAGEAGIASDGVRGEAGDEGEGKRERGIVGMMQAIAAGEAA